jgi:hypothetical protein
MSIMDIKTTDARSLGALAKLIETCNKNNVESLSVNGIEVKFINRFAEFPLTQNTFSAPVVEQDNTQASETTEVRTPKFSQDAMDDLALLDPVEWDRQMLNGGVQ